MGIQAGQKIATEEIPVLEERLRELRAAEPDNETGPEIVDVLNKLAFLYHLNDPIKTENGAREALRMAKELGYKRGIGRAYNVIGISYYIRGFLDKAMDNYIKSVEWLEEENDREIHAGTLNNLGIIYHERKDYRKALSLYEEALSNTADELFRGSILNNIGISYMELEEFELALENHFKALGVRGEQRDTVGLGSSYMGIGAVYYRKNEYDMALEYLFKAIDFLKNAGYADGHIAEAYQKIAAVFIETGDLEKAFTSLTTSLSYSEPGGFLFSQMNGNRLLAEVAEKTGDFKQALEYYRKYSEIKERLSADESDEKIARMQIEFETQKKKRETEIYRLKTAELQDIVERRTAELNDSIGRLRDSFYGTIQIISKIVEMRDPYTSGHQRRVAELSKIIARMMALPEDTIEGIFVAGLVHDIGKISIPQEILSKPGTLTGLEVSLIRMHPETAYEILKDVHFPWPIAEIVLQHHEKIDGSGYPSGLKGNDIMLEARILSVADIVEAMLSDRPYRPILGLSKALAEISENRGLLYDPDVTDICIDIITEGTFPFYRYE